jgi:diguanylate cyclase (GGDEF)-like protein
LLGKELGDAVSKNYQKCAESKKSIMYEEKLNLPGGELYWMTTLTPIMEDDKVTKIIGSATDITGRKKLELKMEKHANYDKLTELPNRRLFFERFERLIVESERDNNQFALLFIDLDGFKEINDNYGHECGDEVLITVGNRLLQCIRKSDTVARMGGDEFAILIRNIKDKREINNVVEKIHKTLQEVMHIGDVECRVNSSIGVTMYPDHGKDSKILLTNADSTMYEIKRNGKGGFKFFRDVVINEK